MVWSLDGRKTMKTILISGVYDMLRKGQKRPAPVGLRQSVELVMKFESLVNQFRGRNIYGM